MRRFPGQTTAAVVVLALAIGLTTTVFGVLDAVLLQPLPVAEADRLVQLWGQDPERNIPFFSVAYADVAEWSRRSKTLEHITASRVSSASVTTGGDPESAPLIRVGWELFRLLGTRPAAGRFYGPEEDVPEGPRVAVIVEGIASRHFGTIDNAIGRTITLDGTDHEVIAVLPSGFWFPGGAAGVLVPLAESDDREPGSERRTVSVYARLAAGRTIDEAQAEIDEMSRQLDEEFSASRRGPRDVRAWGVHQFMTRHVRPRIMVLSGGVVLVLLIACGNLANLMLVRTNHRRRELAVRGALGAGRLHLAGQLLCECLLVTVVGGIGGVLLAWVGVRVLVGIAPAGVPLMGQLAIDGRVVLFAVVISVLASLLFGLGPAVGVALRSSPSALSDSLRASGRSSGVRAARLRRLLVVAELAGTAMLLVAAGLLLRSFMRMQAIDPGFSTSGVVSTVVALRAERFGEPAQRLDFFRRMLDELHTSPGIEAAGIVSTLPLTGTNRGAYMVSQSGAITQPEEAPVIWFRLTTPGYFSAMSIPLVKGRMIEDPEIDGAVVLVNEAFATRFWPGEDPIGKQLGPAFLRTGMERVWSTVIGVVGNVRHMNLTRGPDLELFIPYNDDPFPVMRVVVRTSLDGASVASVLAAAAAEADPAQAVSAPLAMEDAMRRALASGRLSAALLGTFAIVALALAAVGLYGVISYGVGQRTAEIGIRIAVGAEPRNVLCMVFREGLTTTLAGVGVGAVAALALNRLLSTMLYQVSAWDAATFAVVIAVTVGTGLLATVLPARRAARLDPVAALGMESLER